MKAPSVFAVAAILASSTACAHISWPDEFTVPLWHLLGTVCCSALVFVVLDFRSFGAPVTPYFLILAFWLLGSSVALGASFVVQIPKYIFPPLWVAAGLLTSLLGNWVFRPRPFRD